MCIRDSYNLTHHKDDHYYYDDSCWSPDSHHNHGGSSGHTHYMYNKVNNNAYTPVSYTHLDVYKRQGDKMTRPVQTQVLAGA